MFHDYHYAVVRDRSVRQQDLAERMSQHNGYASSANWPSFRVRMASWLFSCAGATEREETRRLARETLGSGTPVRSVSQEA